MRPLLALIAVVSFSAFAGPKQVLIIDESAMMRPHTKAALEQEGFTTLVFTPTTMPEPADFKRALTQSSELWLFSGSRPQLLPEHVASIKSFFDAGHGVFLWGGDEPFFADANVLAAALLPGLQLEGDLDRFGISMVPWPVRGMCKGHPIVARVENHFEGTAISSVQFTKPEARTPALTGPSCAGPLPAGFSPLLYGRGGKLVAVAYERGGKRLVIDGGVSRLVLNWEEATMGRYVKNAASWLAH